MPRRIGALLALVFAVWALAGLTSGRGEEGAATAMLWGRFEKNTNQKAVDAFAAIYREAVGEVVPHREVRVEFLGGAVEGKTHERFVALTLYEGGFVTRFDYRWVISAVPKEHWRVAYHEACHLLHDAQLLKERRVITDSERIKLESRAERCALTHLEAAAARAESRSAGSASP